MASKIIKLWLTYVWTCLKQKLCITLWLNSSTTMTLSTPGPRRGEGDAFGGLQDAGGAATDVGTGGRAGRGLVGTDLGGTLVETWKNMGVLMWLGIALWPKHVQTIEFFWEKTWVSSFKRCSKKNITWQVWFNLESPWTLNQDERGVLWDKIPRLDKVVPNMLKIIVHSLGALVPKKSCLFAKRILIAGFWKDVSLNGFLVKCCD